MAKRPRVTGNPPGQPTKYNPARCDEIIAHMGKGLSATAAAGEMNITRMTLHNWEKEHPEFAEAMELGRIKRQAFLEKQLMSPSAPGMVPAMIFALKNANPKEWRDKQELEHTGKDGGAIQLESVRRDADAFAGAMARLAAGAHAGGTIEADTGSQGRTELAVAKLVGKA
jgi:hypothetical protein